VRAGRLLARLIRAHGGRRDEASWTASLRGGPGAPSDAYVAEIASLGIMLLDLSGNNLASGTAEELALALENDAWVLGINLGLKHVSPEVIEPLARALKRNSRLTALLIGESKRHTMSCVEEREIIESLLHRALPYGQMPHQVTSCLQAWRERLQKRVWAAKFSSVSETLADQSTTASATNRNCKPTVTDGAATDSGLLNEICSKEIPLLRPRAEPLRKPHGHPPSGTRTAQASTAARKGRVDNGRATSSGNGVRPRTRGPSESWHPMVPHRRRTLGKTASHRVAENQWVESLERKVKEVTQQVAMLEDMVSCHKEEARLTLTEAEEDPKEDLMRKISVEVQRRLKDLWKV
jgi:hypothetical protein